MTINYSISCVRCFRDQKKKVKNVLSPLEMLQELRMCFVGTVLDTFSAIVSQFLLTTSLCVRIWDIAPL